jgi:hypothetical protein
MDPKEPPKTAIPKLALPLKSVVQVKEDLKADANNKVDQIKKEKDDNDDDDDDDDDDIADKKENMSYGEYCRKKRPYVRPDDKEDDYGGWDNEYYRSDFD